MSIQTESIDSEGFRLNDSGDLTAVACLVLVDSESRVLITQRPCGKKLGGFWEFPGGKVETGESAEAALLRELQEELKLEVELLRPMSQVTHFYEFGTIKLIPFFARCKQRPIVHLMEHSAYTWACRHTLSHFDLAPADLPVVEELNRFLDGKEIQTKHLPKQ